jgi:hypothetical protein
MYEVAGSSVLNLYAGKGGLVPGGRRVTINGLRGQISVNRTKASVSVTFPDLNDWISISAFPTAHSAAKVARQVGLELQIVDSVRATSS